jgi:hypothetical protein
MPISSISRSPWWSSWTALGVTDEERTMSTRYSSSADADEADAEMAMATDLETDAPLMKMESATGGLGRQLSRHRWCLGRAGQPRCTVSGCRESQGEWRNAVNFLFKTLFVVTCIRKGSTWFLSLKILLRPFSTNNWRRWR